VLAVWQQHRSLNEVLPEVLKPINELDQGFVRALVYQTLRHFEPLLAQTEAALSKPLKRKDLDIQCLLMVGLCQQHYFDTPPLAAVHATVEATRILGKPWARGLINAILRRAQRTPLPLPDTAAVQWAHPQWLIDQFQAAYPDAWQELLQANLAPGPMTLRIDGMDRDEWLAEHPTGQATTLSPWGVTLEQPTAVQMITGFAEGQVSVQDEAAQMATWALDPQPNERVLDACAAPGGKTGHLWAYTAGRIDLWALDASTSRMQRVHETLERLQAHSVKTRVVAAEDTEQWWDNQAFDRILIDAPCSGTGVIRRHPDIKLLRTPEDIPPLLARQRTLLEALWRILKPGGTLLYTTCSVLPAENSEQIAAFLQAHTDAELHSCPWPTINHGQSAIIGEQWLPQNGGADGFYYAKLCKRSDVVTQEADL
jgi:16S rRNA (cytosine967-C5)-methyltransferase